jgi:hypothetical protein
MNKSKMILAVVLLMAGTLLTTAAVTMVPAAYAGGDNYDGNEQKAEDESQAALADCDENEVERAGFDCIAVAELIEDISDGNGPPPPPGECEECFDELDLEQLQALADEIEDQFDIEFPDTSTRDAIIATICEALILGPPDGLTVGNVNAAMAQLNELIPIDVRQEIQACLNDLF